MSLTVLDPGFFSLVVDHGRPRSRSLGVPVGGAADRAALALGNALLGNPADAAALEVTLAGPTLRADVRVAGVLFGAPFTLMVPGKRHLEPGVTFTLDPGDTLKIGGTPTGVRGYLCVAGGFEMPTILDSRSGLEPVQAGDVLPCGESATPARGLPFISLPSPLGGEGLGVRGATGNDRRPATDRPSPQPSPPRGEGARVRVLPGPQFDWFIHPETFFESPYEVSPAGNRMGLRLTGPPLERRPGELVSEAVAPGAVQVTNDGQPIVLGVDGQTIGGYPKVAHVVRADLDLLAQLRPGEAVRFVRVTPAEAEAAAADRAARLGEWLLRLRVSAGL